MVVVIPLLFIGHRRRSRSSFSEADGRQCSRGRSRARSRLGSAKESSVAVETVHRELADSPQALMDQDFVTQPEASHNPFPGEKSINQTTAQLGFHKVHPQLDK